MKELSVKMTEDLEKQIFLQITLMMKFGVWYGFSPPQVGIIIYEDGQGVVLPRFYTSRGVSDITKNISEFAIITFLFPEVPSCF
jgi:hypothetical protein